MLIRKSNNSEDLRIKCGILFYFARYTTSSKWPRDKATWDEDRRPRLDRRDEKGANIGKI